MRRILAIAAGLMLGLVFSGSVSAQTEEEFVAAFAGQWQVYDGLYGDGDQRCSITLSAEAADNDIVGDYALATSACKFELAGLSSWRIVEGQLALLNQGEPVALLGGNQVRLSGSSGIGAPIILDRISEPAFIDPVAAARDQSGCYYLGFTDTCAEDAQLQKPSVASSGASPRVNVLVNLNARTEPRNDAAVLGVVPSNSCIVVDVCADTSDGVWCRADFDGQNGWLKKSALRQETWPVVTFVNQCATPVADSE